MSDDKLSFEISKEIVTPIVESKIKGAILEMLGNKEVVIDRLLSQILDQKVDASGKPSSYSSDSKRTYLDFIFTQQIESAIKEELTKQLLECSGLIKESLIKKLQSKKGVDSVAAAMMDAMNSTFESSWKSKIIVEIKPQPTED